MKLELKSCPFCGNNVGDLCSNYSYKVQKHFVWVECGVCGARSKAISSDDDPTVSEWQNKQCQKVISAWNMRCSCAE